VDRQARNFIGAFTYDELRSETDDVERQKQENFSDPVRKLTFCLPEEEGLPESQRKGTKGTIGITVNAANLESIVLSGPAAEENEQLSVARYTADRKAESVRIGADAEAYATTTDADARAHATKVTGEAEAASITARLTALNQHPELASALLMSEAIAKPGDGKVIIVPSDILGMVGKGLQGAKKAAGGGR
jgi:regulator of protease activity HflC (stomatin/prohibitin superfamily)